MTTLQKKAFMMLCLGIYTWQKEAYDEEEFVQKMVDNLNVLPEELKFYIQPSLRQFYGLFRGDDAARLKEVDGGMMAMPDYQIAGFGNENIAKLFAWGHGRGRDFILSGKDVTSAAAAISTEKLYKFIGKAERKLDEFSEQNESREWAFVHQGIGDDESEVVVIRPKFRLFRKREVDQGRSANAKLKNAT